MTMDVPPEHFILVGHNFDDNDVPFIVLDVKDENGCLVDCICLDTCSAVRLLATLVAANSVQWPD